MLIAQTLRRTRSVGAVGSARIKGSHAVKGFVAAGEPRSSLHPQLPASPVLLHTTCSPALNTTREIPSWMQRKTPSGRQHDQSAGPMAADPCSGTHLWLTISPFFGQTAAPSGWFRLEQQKIPSHCAAYAPGKSSADSLRRTKGTRCAQDAQMPQSHLHNGRLQTIDTCTSPYQHQLQSLKQTFQRISPSHDGLSHFFLPRGTFQRPVIHQTRATLESNRTCRTLASDHPNTYINPTNPTLYTLFSSDNDSSNRSSLAIDSNSTSTLCCLFRCAITWRHSGCVLLF